MAKCMILTRLPGCGWRLKIHELCNLPFAIRNLQFAGEPVRSEVGGAPLTMTGSPDVRAWTQESCLCEAALFRRGNLSLRGEKP